MLDRRLVRVLLILRQLEIDYRDRNNSKPKPVKDLAKVVAISNSYTEKILKELREVGLVTGHRGVSGGYRLNSHKIEYLTIGALCDMLDYNMGQANTLKFDLLRMMSVRYFLGDLTCPR